MELTFGEQIKIILKRKNMTIRQLAELVEVQTGKPMSRQNLTQKLNRDNFQEQDMKEIAQALGCVVKISVVDPAGEVLSPVVSRVAETVQSAGNGAQGTVAAAGPQEGRRQIGRLRAGRHGTCGLEVQMREEAAKRTEKMADRLAREEAAVTRQPVLEEPDPAGKSAVGHTADEDDVNADVLREIEMALMESVQKEMNFEPDSAGKPSAARKKKEEEREVDSLAWASQKPLVWPTLTVPTTSVKQGERSWPSVAGEAPAGAEGLPSSEEPPSKEPSAGELSVEESPVEKMSAKELPAEEPASGELPFEEEPFSELEDIPIREGEVSDDFEDLEFFDLEDFIVEETSRVSAPYVMRREKKEESERSEEPVKRERGEKREKPEKSEKTARRQTEEKERPVSFDRVPDSDGVSFASAPYVISRGPETDAVIIKEETEAGGAEEEVSVRKETPEEGLVPAGAEEKEPSEGSGEAAPSGFRTFGGFSGSRGDISSVSAPYVIPREPEELPPSKPMGETGYWQEPEGDDWSTLTPEESAEEPEEEAEPLSPDMEEKIASWDAAVKRRLENPFLRALEGRARRGGRGTEPEIVTERSEVGREETNTRIRPEQEDLPEQLPGGRREEEPLDLQGPALDPVTGKEYETNTVKHHPTEPDMLLVYDQDEHRWIVQAERAFLNFQINKRALLGKDYEPPLYLD